jgi:hypothetical protein
MPIFDRHDIKMKAYPWDDDFKQRDEISWATTNVMIALAIRYTVSKRPSHYEDMESLCVKNVQSSLARLLCEPSLPVLRITLGLALFFMGTEDPEPASMLIGSAVKMVHGMKLHLAFDKRLLIYRGEHERLFWITYILDRQLSLIKSEPYLLQDHDIGLNLNDMPTGVGVGNVISHVGRPKEVLRERVELALIQGKVFDLVYSVRRRSFLQVKKKGRNFVCIACLKSGIHL